MTHPLTPREKVLLKPCPFCGGEAVAGSNFDNDHYVMCGADCDKCGGMVGYMKTEMAAIENWNRRTALASGSGDHAELARLAEDASSGPWSVDADDLGRTIVASPVEIVARDTRHNSAFIAAANPATVLALLAEIAALRGANYIQSQDMITSDARATEAERKLAEAERGAEFIARLLPSAAGLDDAPDNKVVAVYINMRELRQARTFLSKEAERG